MLWSMYWLNYLDRNAIALARLNDLEEDLNLSSTEYQTCVSILFVGYILGQIPSNMFLNRTRPSRYMVRREVNLTVHEGLDAKKLLGSHDDALGYCERSDCTFEQLCWPSLDTFLPWYH